MAGFTTSISLKEMINKFPMRKRKKNAKKKIRKQVFLKNIYQVLKVQRDREEQN